jgi:hypothetical protein
MIGFDINETKPYDEMRREYNRVYSLGFLGPDIKTKFALISIICYLTTELQKKKPDITFYQLIRKLGENMPEDHVKALAVICEDFAYGCENFLTFDMKPADMPKYVKKLLDNYLPF